MIRRLRVKLVCVLMAVAAALLCVLFGTVLHFTRSGLEAESFQAMRAAAMEPLGLVRPGTRSDAAQLPCFILQMGRRGELMVSGNGYYDLTDEAFLKEVLAQEPTAGCWRRMACGSCGPGRRTARWWCARTCPGRPGRWNG